MSTAQVLKRLYESKSEPCNQRNPYGIRGTDCPCFINVKIFQQYATSQGEEKIGTEFAVITISKIQHHSHSTDLTNSYCSPIALPVIEKAEQMIIDFLLKLAVFKNLIRSWITQPNGLREHLKLNEYKNVI